MSGKALQDFFQGGIYCGGRANQNLVYYIKLKKIYSLK